jgi:aryl-phospho-beta-D-glucosidase BglC (GH1 family)
MPFKRQTVGSLSTVDTSTTITGLLNQQQESSLLTGINKNPITGEVWIKDNAGLVTKIQEKVSDYSSGLASYNYPNTSPLPTPVVVDGQDAYIGEMMKDLSRFRAWGGVSTNLFIGEIGVPTDRTGLEAEQWTNFLDCMLTASLADRIPFFYWSDGLSWGDYNMIGHKTNSGKYSKSYISDTLTKHWGQSTNSGTNLSYLEFNDGDIMTDAVLEDLAFFKGRGCNNIRLPIDVRFLMKFGDTDISTTGISYIKKIETFLNLAQKVGIQVMLDVHNYAEVKIDKNTSDSSSIIGANPGNRVKWNNIFKALLNAKMIDGIGRKITLKDHPSLFMIDIMNEPAPVPSNVWEVESQEIVNTIRSTGYTKEIAVPISAFDAMRDVFSLHKNGPWIKDIFDGKIWYTGHIYFDHVKYQPGNYPNKTGNERYSGNYFRNYTDKLNNKYINVPYSDFLNESKDPNRGKFDKFGNYSNTKASSSAKLTGLDSFSFNGGTRNITIPAGTTKVIGVITYRLPGGTGSVPASKFKIGSVNSVNLVSMGGDDTFLDIFEFNNTPTGNVVMELNANAYANFNVQLHFWSGLKVDNSPRYSDFFTTSDREILFDTNNVTDGSISLIITSSLDQPNHSTIAPSSLNDTVQDNKVQFLKESFANDQYRTGSIYSEYRQNGNASIFHIYHKIVGSIQGARSVSVEFPTENYKILPPASIPKPLF